MLFTYNIRKILVFSDPLPLVTVIRIQTIGTTVCFSANPLSLSVRTSFVNVPLTKLNTYGREGRDRGNRNRNKNRGKLTEIVDTSLK